MNQPICFFIPSLKGGGAERVAVLLANSIVKDGGSVQVVVQHKDGAWRATLDPRVPVIVLGGRYRWLTFRMVRYLKRYNPVAVISFINWFNIIALMAVALSGWRGRLIVSERVSLQATWAEYGLIRSWVLWGLMRLLYRRADRVVAVSQQLADDLVVEIGVPTEKIVFIPNPVPVEEIRQSSMIPVSHRFFSEDLPVLIAVGRLHSQKDFPTLLRAVADLRVRRDVRLIVLGEGPARSEVEVLVESLGLSEVVDFPGFVSPPWPFIARADMLVLSSRAEGWPNVIVEALALGVPVVATDCPTGPREILDEGRFGRLVPVGDFVAFSVAVEAMLDNPSDRASLRARADEWSTGRALKSYLSCLQTEKVV